MTEQPTSPAKRNCDGQPSLAPATGSADARRIKSLLVEAEAAVTALRSIESMLQEEVSRVIQGYRGKWSKVSLVASDTACHMADDLEAAIMDVKLKGGDGK